MITKQSDAGIGAPRPHTSGLSATVAGLQQPASSKWAEAYADNRFGSGSTTVRRSMSMRAGSRGVA